MVVQRIVSVLVRGKTLEEASNIIKKYGLQPIAVEQRPYDMEFLIQHMPPHTTTTFIVDGDVAFKILVL